MGRYGTLFKDCTRTNQALAHGLYCLNGGKCDVDNTSIDNVCLCPDGFAGMSCDRSVVRCPGGNYCENGATCMAGGLGFGV